MKNYRINLLLCFTLLIFSCEKDSDPAPDCQPELLPGTRYFEFITDRDQIFQAWTSDTMVINQVLKQLELPRNERNLHINGKILANPGKCNYNQNWSWYFDPNEWVLAELSIELCDGDPQYVEENVAEYIRIGGYCPWGSVVHREVDNPFD